MTAAPTDNDARLIATARNGNHAAFDALVRRHTPRMYRVAVRIVDEPAEAEDVVQEAWIAAWRALDRFRGEAAVSTWLYRVVTNTALAHVRRRKHTVPLDEVLDGTHQDHVADQHSSADPERSALRSEQVDAVQAAIGTLDPSQRVPLVLHELEGLSYDEVAAVLGVSVPALRSRLHRARVTLLTTLRELR